MLLAIDVGNTETLVGVFQGTDLAWHWRSSTVPERTADEMALLLGGFLEQQGLSFSRQITGVVLASVVPNQTLALREMVRNYFHFTPVVVEPGTRTGIPIHYDNPKDVGADRIANAAAAFAKFGGPSIVVDFGTATTFDVISTDGEYLGGAICPGIKLSSDALFGKAARLPKVELAAPHSVIARSTVESMQAGLVLGTASMVDGMVERIAKELGHATVIATGGLASLVIEHCSSVEHHEPWLTLEGLRLIYDRNAGRDD
ncbi:MAG: type III pantothenate kinase [Actinomycetota bacterium]